MAAARNHNLIECLIEREGPTIFFIGKVQYVFAPRPELTGDMKASVCVVVSQEHRDYLTKDRMCSQYYRVYEPAEPLAEDLLEQEEFREWQRLRKTMTPEEIMAMTMKSAQVVESEPPAVVPEPVKATGRRATPAAAPVAPAAAPANQPINADKPAPPTQGGPLDEMF